MAQDEFAADLSAYLDKELAPSRAEEIAGHLKACPGCAAELARLQGASSRFKAAGTPRAPAGLEAEILRAASAPPAPRGGRLAFTAGAAAVLAILLLLSSVLRPQLSAVFNQVMGMISGAASTVGSGE